MYNICNIYIIHMTPKKKKIAVIQALEQEDTDLQNAYLCELNAIAFIHYVNIKYYVNNPR